ncbi:MAG TPA: diguanylate cyclase [Solirubrobacteraceae bacterium]|nr:diguanylate cyclase [Solirubrobacteraceae bacterium]
MPRPASPPRLLARIAVAGMSLAVVALGALAVWAAIVTQNGAHGLSQAGVQTSGHLRAIQALSMIDTSTDALEVRIVPSELAKLRKAQRVLDDALDRMENGGVRQASQIAEQGKPIVERLKPAIEQFLARPPGYDSNGTAGAEEEMEDIMAELQVLLNDLDADPSRLLVTKLQSVTATERTVRVTAFTLIPLGLGGVAGCGWLLSLYRRRSEATMRAAFDMTAEEARTDELTGLPNRRALLEELEYRSNGNQSFTLTIADLNGFKRYNDTFGHPAGDALLRRLGRKLAAACEGRGIAARLGGDEFCVLFFGDMPADEAHALLSEALSDEGEGFDITAAAGLARVPEEARDPTAALRLADSRMYAAKVRAHPSAEQGMSTTLMRMLDEHHPGLGSHVKQVADLAVACAEELGLSVDDVRGVKRAAELHDLGKVAIPSAILTKVGPLNDEEWEFMRRHSIIGERILGGIPSLEHVASLVRWSHERWDGHGYPDGLAGEEIPIGARIIFAADAFCAMTEERPYAQARSVDSARLELRACSGAQFDPVVVTAFLAVLDSRDARADDRASPAMALT